MGHPDAHSFVLRIWLEDPSTDLVPTRWRGRITNVLDQRSQVVQEFRQIEEFVREYLAEWEVDAPPA